jgi:hypothetical protein
MHLSRMSALSAVACLAAVLLAPAATAQTTQGMIAGQVFDAETRRPIARASVEYVRWEEGQVVDRGSKGADDQGRYAFPLLPPGAYQLRVCEGACLALRSDPLQSGEYQPQEIYGLDLPVAARVEVNFALRRLTDVWKAGIQGGLYEDSTTAIVQFYAADAAKLRSAYLQLTPYRTSALGATVSYVVDPGLVDNLPLTGRDIYSALVLEPGVTADNGTARGLGLSANGQRPTASNYLMDGVQNNNTLITGPLTSLAPEMVQEYRLSTSTWSAEYGNTAGFLANAVTRGGGGAWHGQAWFHLKNDTLNGNTFQNNATGVVRQPFKETQWGLRGGGPVWKKTLFFSGALEIYRSRALQPESTVYVASPLLVNQFSPNSPGRILLTAFPTPATDPGDKSVSPLLIRPPVSIDRKAGLARADYVAAGRRVMLRAAVDQLDRPDFIWYPYKDFISGMSQPVTSLALGYSQSFGPALTQELHAGWNRNTIGWDRAHPEIPTLAVGFSDYQNQSAPLLPGSPAFYDLHYTNRGGEFNDALTWVHGRHIVKAGGGLLLRAVGSASTPGAFGEVTFNTIDNFAIGRPNAYTAAMYRLPPLFQPATVGRDYRHRQFSGFAEDTWRVSRRLAVNAGIRYEYFGAPVNTGAVKDVEVHLGSGGSFPERLAGATLAAPAAGNQTLTQVSGNLAPRAGFVFDAGGDLPVIRGGYGIFFDHPFDNLANVATNSVLVPPALACSQLIAGVTTNLCQATTANPQGYLAPVGTMLSILKGTPFAQIFPALTLIDPNLHDGYTQSYFLSLEKRLSDSLEVDLNTLGALGRRLITTDVINRALSTPQGRYNAALPDVQWRSSQGASNYQALSAVARYHSARGAMQVSYTWSHSIDNQSDPLLGDFFDLSFVNISGVNISGAGPTRTQAAFTQQFNSSGDRASSDFDQRHNLVFYSWWNVPAAGGRGVLPALTRYWRLAEMAAFRTGFPYTVSSAATGALLNQRADIVDAAHMAALPGAPADPGSVALLNKAAFAAPPNGVVGNSGRNAFGGPGLWSVDLSVSRTIGIPGLGESRRLILRADFFNAFNHANLNNPDARVGSLTFGQASYGRLDYNNGFPALVPLNETPRQIQFLLKLEF